MGSDSPQSRNAGIHSGSFLVLQTVKNLLVVNAGWGVVCLRDIAVEPVDAASDPLTLC